MNEYGEVIIYQTDDGLTKLNVSLQNETVWLTIDQMAELFQRDKSTISRHINKILKRESWFDLNCCIFCNRIVMSVQDHLYCTFTCTFCRSNFAKYCQGLPRK